MSLTMMSQWDERFYPIEALLDRQASLPRASLQTQSAAQTASALPTLERKMSVIEDKIRSLMSA